MSSSETAKQAADIEAIRASAVKNKTQRCWGLPEKYPAPILCLIYLIKFAGVGAFYSFLPMYFYNTKDLSFTQIGVFGLARPMMTFIGAPFWTSFADQRKCHRELYLITSILAIGSRMSYLFVDRFTSLIMVCLFTDFVGSAASPMLDHGVLATMKDPTQWGRYRLWGAIGYGISVGIMGMAIASMNKFELMFIIHATFSLTAVMLVMIFLPLGASGKPQSKDGRVPEKRLWTLSMVSTLVFGTVQRTVFFAVVFLCGIMTGVIENFLFLFLQNDVHASKSLIGLSRTITCAAEVPMFWFSSILIKKLGVLGVLSLACVCYMIRFISYSLIEEGWVVLMVEPLHGITYAVMWSASASYAHIIAPEGMGSSSQGILQGIHWGIGQACGAFVGGLISDNYGARAMFRITSGLAGLSLGLMGVTKWYDSYHKHRSSDVNGTIGHTAKLLNEHGEGNDDSVLED